MKIGILGGTFDPIHLGHLSLAHAARRQFSLDKLFLVPAFQPPHKKDREDMAPARMRRRMVELAIAGEHGIEFCDVELARGGVSYTVDTVKQMSEKFPDSELFLIIGSDSLQSLSSWKDIDKIRKLAQIAVARRPGSLCSPAEGVIWIDMPEVPVSSSLIRQKISRREPLENLLPVRVAEFIQQNNLYSAGS